MTEGTPELKPAANRRGPAVLRPLEYVFGPWTRENLMTWLRLIVAVLVVKWLVIDPYRVPSGSMEPTLYGHMDYLRDDRVVVNKLAYGVRIPMTDTLLFPTGEPRRWDVAVFRTPEQPDAQSAPLANLWPKVLIKRVVGLPGERIHIQDGNVFVNGKPLDIPKDMPPVHYTSLAPGDPITYVIGNTQNGDVEMKARGTRMRYGVWDEDQYAVVPKDSYLMLGDNSGNSVDGRYFGWVPRDHLIGRAYAIWWPVAHARDLSGFTHTAWGKALLIGIPLALVLYELAASLITQSWRVREPRPDLALAKNDRLRVNNLATGLRLPFTRRRITRGSDLRPGELVVYHAPKRSEWAGAPLLGVIRESGDDGYLIDSAEGPDYPDSRAFGRVPRAVIVGRAESVWWPMKHRRTLTPAADTQKESTAKARYGEED